MLKVSDLPESTLESGAFLYCPECDERYSATRGDYFWMPANEPILCGNEGNPMVLATETCTIHFVAA